MLEVYPDDLVFNGLDTVDVAKTFSVLVQKYLHDYQDKCSYSTTMVRLKNFYNLVLIYMVKSILNLIIVY